MTAPSTSTQDPYAQWGIRDWITVLHNASTVPPDDPRYGGARQVMAESLVRMNGINDASTASDAEKLKPGALPAFLVAFGNGASLGATSRFNEGTSMYLQNAPRGAKIAGNIAGMLTLGGIASPLVAGLSPAAGGVVLGGGMGAAGGAINTQGNPLVGAAIGGLTGAALGGVGGKIADKIAPIASQVGRNFMRVFSRSMPKAAATDATETAIRAWFQRQGVTDAETVERGIAAWRKTGTVGSRAAPAARASASAPAASGADLETPAYTRGQRSLSDVESANVAKRTSAVDARNAAYNQARASGRVPMEPEPVPSASDQIREIEFRTGRALSQSEKDAVLSRWQQRQQVGQPAISGRPELGTVVPAGPTQLAAPATRVASPAPAGQLDLAQKQAALFDQVVKSGDPDRIAALRALLGLE